MKKTVLLIIFIFASAIGGYAQCIRTALYPSQPVVSNNLGLPQTVTTSVFSSEYSQVSNLTIGLDYVFTCKLNLSDKYITVTDWSNVVIAHGPSPLTVDNITSNQVRLHYSDDAACASTSSSHTVTVQALLSCPPILTMSVADITTTSANFIWTPSGTETAWQVLVVPNGTAAPTATTSGTDVSTNPTYTPTNLLPSNLYQFYIRANCGTEFSPWNGPLNFASQCEPFTTITENFDAYPYGVLPTCWSQIKNGVGSSQYSYASISDYNFNSPSRAISIYSEDSQTTANLILATPAVTNLSAGTHRLKFFAKSNNTPQEIKFGTINVNSAAGVFTEIGSVTVSNTYEEYAIDYTQYEGTDTYIAIKHAGASNSTLYIDDIRWELSPLCPDVTQLSIPAVTANTATINWIAGGEETEWDVVYGATTVTDPNTLTPVSPAATIDPEKILTGLTDNTTYKVWVRSVCGENDGAWIGPKSFKTACLPASTINENFDALAYGTVPDCWSVVKNGAGISQNAYVKVTDYNYYSAARAIQLYNSNSTADSNIILVSPTLNNVTTQTHRVKFFARSESSTGSLQVGTIDNPTIGGNFSEIETVELTTTYQEFTVDFTTTNGSDPYIAFRHNTAFTNSAIIIDNIVWEPIPACADVSGITVSGATASTASINWTPGADQTEWDVVYGATTVTDPNTLTPIVPAPTTNAEATITGLTDNTTYKAWVRSVCNEDNGAWIGPITFKTSCLPTASFTQNFDALEFGTVPDCWSAVKGVGVSESAYAYVVTSNFNSPSRAVRMNKTDSEEGSNLMLVSPYLSNVSAGTHRVKFFAKSNAENGSVQVGTVDNTTANAAFSEMETFPLTSTYTEFIVNFNSYEGTDSYISFRNSSPDEYSSIFIDDIVWEVAPACIDVFDIEINETTEQTASISWSADDNQTNWQVAYGANTVTDPTTLTPSEILTETIFTIPGLQNSTTYKVWVRSVCNGQNGNWIGPVSFNTACPAVATLNENFDSVSFPNLPICWSKILDNASTSASIAVSPYGSSTPPNSVEMYGAESASSTSRIILVSAPVSTLSSGTYQLKFKASGNSTLEVGTLDGTTSSAVFTPIQTVTPNDMSNQNFTVDFSSYTGTDTYIGIRLNTPSSNRYANLDNVVWEENLSVGSFDASQLRYYPNPVKNILNLEYQQNITQVTVYNLLGQKVIENKINTNSAKIDMSALSTGSYIVKIASDNQTKTIKVIKE